MAMKNDQTTQIALAGVISELSRLLAQSAAIAAEAQEAIKKGDRNQSGGILRSCVAHLNINARLIICRRFNQ